MKTSVIMWADRSTDEENVKELVKEALIHLITGRKHDVGGMALALQKYSPYMPNVHTLQDFRGFFDHLANQFKVEPIPSLCKMILQLLHDQVNSITKALLAQDLITISTPVYDINHHLIDVTFDITYSGNIKPFTFRYVANRQYLNKRSLKNMALKSAVKQFLCELVPTL